VTEERYQALRDQVHTRAGDAVRAIARYGTDDWELLYVREDVATDGLREAAPTLVERARDREPIITPDSYDLVGSTQATVELHELAAVVFLHESPTEGVVISLERDVAQGLGQFVNSCTAVLRDT